MIAKSYHLTPRDPVVLGDGRPVDRSKPQLWPIPATLAAALNGWLHAGQPTATLRGPLLQHGGGLFAPPPHDAMRHPDTGVWERGKLIQPIDGGVLWPAGINGLSHLFELGERKDGIKLVRIESPTCLDHLLTWALGQPHGFVACDPTLHHPERRTHVALDPATLTADPGLLFTSPGVRLGEGVSFAFDWTGAPPSPGLVPFGGEGRLSSLEVAPAGWPEWSHVAKRYEDETPDQAWLRVQLLTPGLFDQRKDVPVRPAWLDDRHGGNLLGAGPKLKLIAMRSERYRPFSGWSSQKDTATKRGTQAPRAVRRTVPAGAVYWFGDERGNPLQKAALLEASELLWLVGLDGHTPSTRLGFALALPGFSPSGD